MKVGTRSVLFGAHCFFLHPLFVALAWWRLYGFPFDPRLWVAFFVHDLGYLGKPNMDGAEGEEHPWLGAKIMNVLFDDTAPFVAIVDWQRPLQRWFDFTLYHSRFLAKRHGRPHSRLCVADKLAFTLEPAWLYLPRVALTGELREYMSHHADGMRYGDGSASAHCGAWQWHAEVCRHLRAWVAEHRDGRRDTWTPQPEARRKL